MLLAALNFLLVTKAHRSVLTIISLRCTRWFLLWGMCFALVGCGIHSNTLDSIDDRTSDLRVIAEQTIAEGKSIGWQEAVKLLLENNPQISRAKSQKESTREKRGGYWKEYVPSLRGSASIAKNLGEFDSLKLSDFNVYAFLNLRVPNPVTIQAELMALSLSEYLSAKSCELIKRRELASLYREFLRYEELRLRYEESLNVNEENRKKIKSADLISGIRKANESTALKMRLRKEMDQTSFRISKMLQLSDYRIRPRANELPDIGYSKNYRHLENSDDYGRLALQILAANLEGAWLRHQRVRLRGWARVNLSASAPQAYSSSSDTEFDVESISLFGGITKGFDFFDDQKDLTLLSEKDYKQAISDAYYRIISERETLGYALSQYSGLLKKKKSLEIALQMNRDLIGLGMAAERLTLAIEKQQLISTQLKSINKSIINQELEFWIWDENAWK